jgi:hypothetical protein
MQVWLLTGQDDWRAVSLDGTGRGLPGERGPWSPLGRIDLDEADADESEAAEAVRNRPARPPKSPAGAEPPRCRYQAATGADPPTVGPPGLNFAIFGRNPRANACGGDRCRPCSEPKLDDVADQPLRCRFLSAVHEDRSLGRMGVSRTARAATFLKGCAS